MTDTIEVTEQINRQPAEALAGLLGVPVPDLDAGQPLPPLWHWVYLLERSAQADLGDDGHPASSGIPAAPRPGMRRMFAGGRLHDTGGLQIGRPAIRRSFIRSSADKHGRSGELTFVTVAHEISQDGRLVIAEEQDIVYRAAVIPTRPESAGVPAASGALAAAPLAAGEWQVPISSVLLFRFSALTYNAHRIHYDRDYARDVEGYPGLVVHGPLQAILMAEAARRLRRPAAAQPSGVVFEYRLTSPLFEHQGLVASATAPGPDIATSIRDVTGRQSATGTLRLSR